MLQPSVADEKTRGGHQGTRVVDMDQHFNEDVETWDEVDLPDEKRLNLRDDEFGRRSLYLGAERIGPGRATRADEYDRIARLVRADELAYERELARLEKEPRPFVDVVEPSASDMALRASDMDRMGIDVALQFPSYGFYWPEIVEQIDPQLVPPHFRAWNTWIARQCRLTPGRMVGAGQVGFYEVDEAVQEIHRCRELGLAGVTVAMHPFRGLPWSDPSNTPIWIALEETRLPVFLHITVMNHSLDPDWDKNQDDGHSGPDISSMVNRNLPVEAVLTDLVFGGVLDRHPDLRLVTVECGALWLQAFLDRIDWAYEFLAPRNRYLRHRLPAPPSTYIRRQVSVAAFPFEALSPYVVAEAGDMFLFATDFPHDEGTSRGVELFEGRFDAIGASAEFRRSFYGDSATRLLGLPDLLAPSHVPH